MALAVVGVLAALVMGQVRIVRRGARQLDCSVRMSQAGRLLLAFSTEHRDLLPYGGDQSRRVALPDGPAMRVGGGYGLDWGRWQLLFVDQWTGPIWPRSLGCPQRPQYDPRASVATPHVFGTAPEHNRLGPFWMSTAIWADPDREAVPRQNQVADVQFPCEKVYLFESPGFCVDEPGSDFWVRTHGQTYLYRTSTFFVDGAVRRARPTLAQRLQAGTRYATLHGVRGRDELEP